MRIVKYQILPEIDTLNRLRNVRLKGFGQPFVYQNANLHLISGICIDLLTPPQRYVLRPTVEKIVEIATAFDTQYHIDVFSLVGALFFWTDEMDLSAEPIPFLPPIVEQSIERNNRAVMLINDGMHRVYAARLLNRKPNVIFITNLPPEYPYYAYAIEEGWGGVEMIDELTDGYKKKDYRNPESYKALFRDFNSVFPGIQEQRKQTQAHLKE